MEIPQVPVSNTDLTEGLDAPENFKLQNALDPRAEVGVRRGWVVVAEGFVLWCPQEHPDALRRALHHLLDVHRQLQPAGAAPLPQAAGGLRLLRAGQAGLGEARPGRPLQGNFLPFQAHPACLSLRTFCPDQVSSISWLDGVL